ncbi:MULTISPECIES: metallophosphoesterase [unclassified Sedimentibacter]|uniref:metallophosphoesterase n=1 Tax=unclassified Sedimentibacter TaxID=2649220 RepID=UPI0027DF7F04|nr:metallophosphoesterase [Sedimentibacter sp. MB35-C1]WMJ77765.1 metallophosphoesterase [Sedimentibacter sp. MB35-C1]
MRILVISDSHNFIPDAQIETIKKYGEFNMLIHCGDKYKDAEKFAEKLKIDKVVQVSGNCDFISGKPLLVDKVIEGKKFIITHGHLYNVKSGISKLKEYAREKGADAVIYGHTHCAQNEVIDQILFFNPGSTVLPKCGKESFGILEVSLDKIDGKIVILEG